MPPKSTHYKDVDVIESLSAPLATLEHNMLLPGDRIGF